MTETGDEDEERFFVLRTFTVFCADQVEGEAADNLRAMDHEGQPDAQPDFQPAEELIAATESRHPLRRQPGLLPSSDAGRHFPQPSGRRLHRAPAQGDLRPAGRVLRDRRP